MLCEQKGAKLNIIPVDDRGALVMDELETLLTPRTRLVSVIHISNSLGTVVPIERIIAEAHARGIPVLVDGAQGVPHCRIDVQALDADFYCFSGHKVYGPTGIGVLYGKTAVLEASPPWQGGGDMIETVSYTGYTHDTLPHKFEAGTPHIAGAIGLAAALDYVEGIGLDAIAAHETEILHYAQERLRDISGVRLIGTAPHKAGVISFLVDDIHPYDVGKILDEQGVAVRVGHHCTMPLMTRLQIAGTVRASLGLYNTQEDINRLVRGVRYAQEYLRSVQTRTHAVSSTNGTFDDRLRVLLDDLELFDSDNEKREYLMEFGDALPQYDETYRTEAYRIHGCQSMVWLRTTCDDNRLHFIADSNALITKGMLALIVHLLDGQSPQFVRNLNLEQIITQIGLPSLISARRKNGLASMVARIKRDVQEHGTPDHR